MKFASDTILGILLWVLSQLRFDFFRGVVPAYRKIHQGMDGLSKTYEILLPASTGRPLAKSRLSPQTQTGRAHSRRVWQFPEIRLYRLGPARVFFNRKFSSVVTKSLCVIPKRQETGPWSLRGPRENGFPGTVVAQRGEFVGFAGRFKHVGMTSALFIGTRAPDNYYHWLANAMPSLFLANRSHSISKSVPVLVPEVVQKVPQLVEMLRTVAGERRVQFFSADECVTVKSLYVVDPPPIYDTPLSESVEDRLPLSANRRALRDFRQSILDMVPEASSPVTRSRLFLLRPEGDARAAHEIPLRQIAERLGFYSVDPSSLSFEAQVQLFAGAKIIAGISGAAFANVIFSSRPTVVNCRLTCNDSENFFSLLADVAGGKYFCVSGYDTSISNLQPALLQNYERVLLKAIRNS